MKHEAHHGTKSSEDSRGHPEGEMERAQQRAGKRAEGIVCGWVWVL
jgi:hypothetical protein